jgi:hypothetical protein
MSHMSMSFGWMHTEVAHFLNHDAHFCRVPFLWTPIMIIKLMKLVIHYQFDYENTYVIIFP